MAALSREYARLTNAVTETHAARPVLFLMGPTASGKTDLAVALVERLPLEIVSVDSAMVYRGMDIGTGKPDREVLSRAPHRLIDIREPEETYSAAQFREDALEAIAEIRDAGRVPLLVGGTGLYFRALEKGLSPLPAADPRIRAALESDARRLGWGALHDRLAAVDPASAARIHRNDPQRVQRALEVHAITGKSMSALMEGHRRGPGLSVHAVSLEPAERAWLHQRIARRFRQMLSRGLVEEVAALRDSGKLQAGMPALRAVGYRQTWAHLEGNLDRGALAERGIAATRQLARRQLTWLRGEPDVSRFDCCQDAVTERVFAHFATRMGPWVA
jgi:tRNA dimethylallyltransferase